MKNIDRKLLICQTTGITPENYDKIVNYLEQNNIDISFPEKIGDHDSLIATNNIVNYFSAYNADLGDKVAPTSAERALADKMGVDVQNLIKLEMYFEGYHKCISTVQWTVPITNEQEQEHLSQGACNTFSYGRNSANIICEQLDIEYNHSTNSHVNNSLSYFGEDYLLAEKRDGVSIYQDGKLIETIRLEDNEQNKEFVSEFKDIMSKNNGDISLESVKGIIESIKDEIASENRFIPDALKEKLEELENKRESLENRLDDLEDKLKDNPTSNALVRLKASVQSQLEKVEKTIDDIKIEEINNASGYKEKIQSIKEGIVSEIKMYEEAYKEISGENVKALISGRLELLYEDLDEANDKIAACNRKLNIPTSIQEIETQMKEAGNVVQSFQEIAVQGAEVAANAVEEQKKEVDAFEEKSKNFVVNLDNLFGDLKDLAVGFAQQVASETAAQTAQGTSEAYSQFDTDVKDFLMGALQLCREIKDLVSDIVDEYKDIKTTAVDLVRETTQEILSFAKDKVEELGDKLADLKENNNETVMDNE